MQPLLDRLKDRDKMNVAMRSAAARVLGDMGDAEAAPSLIAAGSYIS